MVIPDLNIAPDSSAHRSRATIGSDLGIAGNSIAEAAYLALARAPGTKFIHSASTGWVNRGEFLEMATGVAASLVKHGLVGGDRVVLNCAGSVELAATYLGVLLARAVAVPANPAYSDRELAHVISDARPAFVVTGDESAKRIGQLAVASQSRAAIEGPGSELPIPAGDIQCLGIGALVRESNGAGHRFEGRGFAPEMAALVAYTSGTTGVPKGALLSHSNLLASTKAVVEAWRWTESDRLLLALPLFHVHGLVVGLTASMCVGSSVLLFESFDPVSLINSVGGAEAPTMYFGVPATYARLVKSEGFSNFSKLRLLVSGSAPLPPDLFDRVALVAGQSPVERYGMSETLMNVSNPYDGPRKSGSVGLALPGVKVALDGKGEILVAGPNVFRGYLGNPEATSRTFTGSWMRTGDVGTFDEDGYLRIESRLGDMVISGGFNVYPREVEDQVRSFGGVRDAAVVGRQSELWGEEVVAFVVASDPMAELDIEALIEHLRVRLVNYKIPKAFLVVDELPRNAMGKVLTAKLREIARNRN